MGGHSSGDFASEYVLKNMGKCVAALPHSLSQDELKKGLNESVQQIHNYLNETELVEFGKKGSGRTVILV